MGEYEAAVPGAGSYGWANGAVLRMGVVSWADAVQMEVEVELRFSKLA